MTNEKYQIAGVEPSPIDHRDYPYVSPYKLEQLPESVDLRDKVNIHRIEDQGPIGSCVGNGGTTQCEQWADHNLSRMFLYNATKSFEGRLGEEGVYTRNMYKVGHRYGIPLEEDYTYDLSMDNVDPLLDSELCGKAFERRIERYEAVVKRSLALNSVERQVAMKNALHEGFLVGFSCTVRNSLYTLDGPLENHSYDIRSIPIGGHFMVAVGYTPKGLIVANSWGEDWGDKGFGLLPWEILSESFFEAYIVREFNGRTIPEQPGIKLEFMNKYRMHARIVLEESELDTMHNLWIGGILNGQLYVKQPTADARLFGNETDLSGGTDQWLPMSEGLDPVNMGGPISGYSLNGDPIRVVSWRDLSAFAGADIYIAYGPNLASANIQKLCTIPADI